MRAHLWCGLACVLSIAVLTPCGAAGQRPGEITGRVAERGGAPLEAALVEVVEQGSSVITDASGRYRFRALSAGRYTLRINRIGYHERVVAADVGAGSTVVLDVDLTPQPFEMAAVDVVVGREPVLGTRIERDAIERSGARTAGDALLGLSGVVLRAPVPGGPQTVSVRGSAGNAVLVLLDGAILNDPVTGEADLSQVSATTIASIVLLPGAQSSRYGPRAEAGVILIETRQDDPARSLEASLGSLVSRSAAVAWGGSAPISWSGGVDWTSISGTFDFELPDEVGGGSGRRANSDARTLDAWLAGSAELFGGTIRLRGATQSGRRGLPGRGYAPSTHARQEEGRLQGSAVWSRAVDRSWIQLSLVGARHVARFRDTAPPFGTAYDDSARVRSVDLRAEIDRRLTGGPSGLGYGAGVELRGQRIEVSALHDAAPAERTDAGAFVHAGYSRGVRSRFSVAAQLRVDRDADQDAWALNRSLTVGLASGSLRAHLAARTSYSPPTLGDQYFRDAVGVEANPDLRAERVPLEIEAGLNGEAELGPMRARLSLTGYRGDVRGMIVWAPDFRFVWSPRNVDVDRIGAEARADAETLDGRLRLSVSHSYARITYDRPGTADEVQVIYRPRHTASIDGAWQHGPWRADLSARFTGTRFPVPAPVNALPPFWTISAGVARDWRVGGWLVSQALRGDRLFDERGSLIFGFPEPGRVLRVELKLRPLSNHSPTKGTP